VVTAIDLDHVEELGPTIESISREKAGIFRSGRPALVASGREEARRVFRDAAERGGAVLHELVEETRIDGLELTLEGSRFRLHTPVRDYALGTPLRGAHQALNAAAAVRAAELLPCARPAGEDAIARGVRSVRWPGRLEGFRARGRLVLLDGCHNPAGAEAAAAFLEAADLHPDLVFGAMADKDVEGIFGPLARRAERVRAVPIESPRAATPEEILRRIGGIRPDARGSASVAAALEELLGPADARRKSGEPGPETIIVAGSLYLVGEARALLLSGRFGAPA
jgi:dihydrofolate synthase/folylpolyglutamate synthase